MPTTRGSKALAREPRVAATRWQETAVEVLDHDFPNDSKGKAVPYGIYDRMKNKGAVFVGYSSDTPSFAVDCVAGWCQKY